MIRKERAFCRATWLFVVGVFGFCALALATWASDYAPGTQVGQITENALAELSGIAASRQNPGVLWVHNDRARDEVFAVSTNGQLLATWSLGEDISDFEDIAIGPGPQSDLQYLYCGDIGDNTATRPSIRVYRVAEPAVYSYQAENPTTPKFPMVEKFTITYPDGSHNAEALLVDPGTADLYIPTKENGLTRIYRAEAAQLRDGAKVVLTFVTELEFDVVSAGDISPDGREILLRQENFAKIWRRLDGQTVGEALTAAPIDVPVIGTPDEPNGEGVAFDPEGTGYYTVSEGLQPVLYFFAKTNEVSDTAIQRLVRPASQWKFFDAGTDLATSWQSPDFDDANWPTGIAQFGYGEKDEQTKISFGADKDQKHITTYFRTEFTAAGPTAFRSLRLRLVYDDGVAVYLNGAELFRTNLSAHALFSEPALASGSSQENLWHAFSVANFLKAGRNTLAVEVHRFSASEGDLSFDLQLAGIVAGAELRFSGPPRLLPEDTWSLEVQGAPATKLTVESSTNLRDWTSVGELVLTNGTGSITLSASVFSSGFYRLRAR